MEETIHIVKYIHPTGTLAASYELEDTGTLPIGVITTSSRHDPQAQLESSIKYLAEADTSSHYNL